MFLRHQIVDITTTPAAVPTGIQIPLDVSWKLNINRATKKLQTLLKQISTIQRVEEYIGTKITYDHISRA